MLVRVPRQLHTEVNSAPRTRIAPWLRLCDEFCGCISPSLLTNCPFQPHPGSSGRPPRRISRLLSEVHHLHIVRDAARPAAFGRPFHCDLDRARPV